MVREPVAKRKGLKAEKRMVSNTVFSKEASEKLRIEMGQKILQHDKNH